MALVVGLELTEGETVGPGPGGDDVAEARSGIASMAQGLAVEGDDFLMDGLPEPRGPADEAFAEGGGI